MSETGSPGKSRPVRFWQLIVPIAGTAIGWLLLAFAAGVALAAIAGRPITEPEIEAHMRDPGTRYIVLQVFLASIYVVALIVLRWTLGSAGKTQMIADYTPVGGSWVFLGAAAGVALVVTVALVTGILAESGMEFRTGEAERAVMPTSVGQLLMAMATIVIAGPYFEELYFRGALLSWLAGKVGIAGAIVAGSVLFALAHGQFIMAPGGHGWVATALLALVGIVASVLAWRSGSLWPPFATHAAFNGTMIVAAFVAPEMQT
jgi:membrane protease YdiL (CAAX protease family)